MPSETVEKRLEAFYTAVQAQLIEYGISAAMMSVSAVDNESPGMFVVATRIAKMEISRSVLPEHLEKMHDDLHEVLNEVMTDLSGGQKAKRIPIELN